LRAALAASLQAGAMGFDELVSDFISIATK
jgi:hypothetical protein